MCITIVHQITSHQHLFPKTKLFVWTFISFGGSVISFFNDCFPQFDQISLTYTCSQDSIFRVTSILFNNTSSYVFLRTDSTSHESSNLLRFQDLLLAWPFGSPASLFTLWEYIFSAYIFPRSLDCFPHDVVYLEVSM